MKTMTPEQIARGLIAFGARDPDGCADLYLKNAADHREGAAKARAAKSGKHRRYTAEQFAGMELRCIDHAITVPAAMRALLAL